MESVLEKLKVTELVKVVDYPKKNRATVFRKKEHNEKYINLEAIAVYNPLIDSDFFIPKYDSKFNKEVGGKVSVKLEPPYLDSHEMEVISQQQLERLILG